MGGNKNQENKQFFIQGTKMETGGRAHTALFPLTSPTGIGEKGGKKQKETPFLGGPQFVLTEREEKAKRGKKNSRRFHPPFNFKIDLPEGGKGGKSRERGKASMSSQNDIEWAGNIIRGRGGL